MTSYNHIRIGRMGPFQDVYLDLAAIAGTLIAITGGNGAGKSTLLQLLTEGGPYRRTSTRGTLAHLATARDSFVEVGFTSGQPWTARQLVDNVSGKGESSVLAADGVPAFSDAKVSSFDAWSKANLPPIEVLHSSSVSVQQSGGFLDLGKSDRMAVLLRVIGAEGLEQQAQRAREQASKALADLDVLRGQLGDSVAEALALADSKARLAAAEAAAADAASAATAAREALRRAELAQTDVQAAAEVRSRRVAAEKRVIDARTATADTAGRLENNRGLVGDAAEIAAAITRDAELVTQGDGLRAAADVLAAEETELGGLAAASIADGGRHSRDLARAQTEQRRARARLEDEVIVAAAAATATKQAAVAAALDGDYTLAEAALAELQGERLGREGDRIVGLRLGLTQVLEPGTDALDEAQKALTWDDDLVVRAETMPGLLTAARARVDEIAAERTLAQSLQRSAEKLAARSGEMATAAEDLQRAMADEIEAQKRIDECEPLTRAHSAALDAKVVEVTSNRREIAANREARAGLKLLLKKAEPLAKAEARIEELERKLAEQSATLRNHEAELAELPPMPAAGESADIDAMKATVSTAEAKATRAASAVGECKSIVDQTVKQIDATNLLKLEAVAFEVELADWKKLAADLGRTGLQAMLVDSAVPTLNAIANEMLHQCHGSRFSVTIKTDRLSSDGKKTMEALDVRIIDNLKGRDDLVESLSGGEGSIVGEAIALALTVLGCECSGVESPDLVRDETGGSLDPDSRDAYVRMLRKAAEMVGAKHVYFVSHDSAMIEAADARIEIDKDGTVEVRDS